MSAVVTISGRNSLNCSYSGQWSFELVVGQPQQPGPSPNSFAGPMKGTFNANGSQGTAQFAASGTIDYFAGGTYDGGTQTISITGISTTGTAGLGKYDPDGRRPADDHPVLCGRTWISRRLVGARKPDQRAAVLHPRRTPSRTLWVGRLRPSGCRRR